tara:strand:- start:18464 stop:18742 length:279 start_codon:yes stop_codon:yes gene_type:complete
MVEDKPYNQFIKNGYKYRVFDPDTEENELKWHYDKNTRDVEVLISSNWLFQLDNHLPKIMSAGDKINIKSGVYHRIIKGSGCLVVRFKEFLN